MARLPSAYQELEYIESDGSQCINTGLTANIGLKYYVKWMSLLTGANAQGILGEEFTWERLGLFKNGTNLYPMVIANHPIALPNPYNAIHEVTFDYPKFVLDNEETTLSSDGSTSTGAVYLFKMGTFYSNIRMYANKWWDEQGNLVRDYIPVKRKSDNIVGMYDLVNGLFYINENQGNFIAGPEVNIQQVITTYKDIILSKLRLPSAYQEVEYIQSDGGQYINTGIRFKYGYKVYVEISEPINRNVTTEYIAGADDSYITQFSICAGGHGILESEIIRGIYGNDDAYPNTKRQYIIPNSSTNYIPAGDYSIESIPESFSVNETTVDYAGTDNFSQNNIYLFTTNRNGRAFSGYYYKGQIKRYTIKDSDNSLVQDFIPCYRKSDNVAGMYDLANGVFYTNAGSGTFTIGPEVVPSNATTYKECILSKSRIPSTYQEVEYIYAPTSQSNNYFGFITGIYQTRNTIMETDVLFTTNWVDAKIHGPFGLRNDCFAGICIYPTNTFRETGKVFNLNQKYHLRIQPSGNNTAFYIDNELGKTFGGIATKVIRLYHYDEGKETVDQDNKVYNVRGMYMYETKFWEGTTLTHDYVPCYVKATNEYGLYDLIDERFLSNDGNGTFAGGPNIYNIITTYKECVVVTI